MRQYIIAGIRSLAVALIVASSLLASAPLATAKTTKMHAFGMRPSSNYEIRRNSGGMLTIHSTPKGSIITTVDAIPGDRFTLSNPIPVPVIPSIPTLALGQNVPNPFNPATRIPFVLHEGSRVQLTVFDVRGTHVVTLVDEAMAAGEHVAEWSGADANGQQVASGVYFYALSAGGQTMSRKMTLLK